MIQVKFSRFLCRIVCMQVAGVGGGGGVSRAVYLDPLPPDIKV